MDQQQVINRALLAIGEWAALGDGYPIARGASFAFTTDNEQTRDNIKAWANDPQGYNAAIILQYVQAYIAAYHAEQRRAKLDAELTAARIARLEARTAVARKLQNVRTAIGLTQPEMDAFLGVKLGTVSNAENPSATYAVDTIEGFITKAQVELKLRGIALSEGGK